jgi:nickel-type superoxide dismutase maturation protease
MLRLVRVTGSSLSPQYREGDFVLISKIPFLFGALQAGDVVVFRHPLYGLLIKQVREVSPDGRELFVVGTQENSIDSRIFGTISRRSLLGKVIWHLRKPAD